MASWVTGIAHDSCKNESFLRAPASRAAHSKKSVHLWGIPPRSPDLNPVEKFWSWLRRRLVALDLRDLKKRKVALGRAAFKLRVQSVCRSQKAQRVAASCALGFKKVCHEVIRLDHGMARS